MSGECFEVSQIDVQAAPSCRGQILAVSRYSPVACVGQGPARHQQAGQLVFDQQAQLWQQRQVRLLQQQEPRLAQRLLLVSTVWSIQLMR